MNILILVLVIIIFILIIYLFLFRREIKRINLELKKLLDTNSNTLLNSEFNNKELNELLLIINKTINYTRVKELDLIRKNKSLKKEITNITHDLRTPLTSSLGYIDLILNSNLSEEDKQKELKAIKNRLLRLEELINSFFELSVMRMNDKKIDMKQINLVSVVEECISRYYDDFNQEERKIVFNNKIKQYNILANEEILKRIIDNLISNALKHSDDDLIINLSNKDDIILKFENEIIEDNLDIECIFDEFYTTDISRTKGNTGLGLAIVKEFTKMLDWNIEAKKKNNRLIIELYLNK